MTLEVRRHSLVVSPDNAPDGIVVELGKRRVAISATEIMDALEGHWTGVAR